ncbi:MAG: LysR family transcriptional regulator [Rhodospirillaceae bacterium]|jgi:LysR family transcriptional regulator, cys regulon transcriptional activator|nr:LysR family transcriptional regulator [Rhodospirillaceae bacterium]
MKLQQLQYLQAVAQEGFSMTRAARALGAFQPAISTQLRLLERELEVDLLVRRNNRIHGLTVAGTSIIKSVDLILREAENLRRTALEFTQEGDQQLVVATTHTYARYALGAIVKEFVAQYPRVKLVLRQGIPAMVAEWVATGAADLGISGRPVDQQDPLIFLPCEARTRSLFVPAGHPLLDEGDMTPARIAAYPLITLDAQTEGGSTVLNAFEAAGCAPNVALSVIDADVAKAYVERGLGVAVLLSMAFEPERDHALRVIDVDDLFERTIPEIMFHSGKHITSAMLEFIGKFAPQWDRPAIELATRHSGRETDATTNA